MLLGVAAWNVDGVPEARALNGFRKFLICTSSNMFLSIVVYFPPLDIIGCFFMSSGSHVSYRHGCRNTAQSEVLRAPKARVASPTQVVSNRLYARSANNATC